MPISLYDGLRHLMEFSSCDYNTSNMDFASLRPDTRNAMTGEIVQLGMNSRMSGHGTSCQIIAARQVRAESQRPPLRCNVPFHKVKYLSIPEITLADYPSSLLHSCERKD